MSNDERAGESKWNRKHAVVRECLAACANGSMKPGKGICKSALEVIRNQELTMMVYDREKEALTEQRDTLVRLVREYRDSVRYHTTGTEGTTRTALFTYASELEGAE